MNFTNQQVDAIKHFEGPALILAVPGSGKTTVLLNRILKLTLNLWFSSFFLFLI